MCECHAKCYICEDASEVLTVDHIKPRNSYPDLEYDWYNLLLACEHCNGVKGSNYSDIISPIECDPEAEIAFAPAVSKLDRVDVTAISKSQKAANTVKLLNAVYNAENADPKRKLECARLKNKLWSELVKFRYYIEYFDKPGYNKLICENIGRASVFAAFKRKIIRDDPQLSAVFAKDLI
ncbi:MAG: HNH endonuclease [Deltaproteobacteria bacterium]|jgi:hypothetical protein|nr:HNH endonuclease [Deltaproteobacteria bacterium]